MITTIPVTQLHRVIGKTLIIERMTGRWRAPLLYTITSVRWDPDHRMVAIGIGDDHPSPAPAGLSL
ncbi:MAG: hypothetical protein ABJB33_06115, partial [Gemmatimonadota bacterium]